jgi:hypothetical protein
LAAVEQPVSLNLSPCVKISFAGKKAETRVEKTRNPTYNQELNLACQIPCMNNLIKVEIWNDNLIKDERIGTHYFEF